MPGNTRRTVTYGGELSQFSIFFANRGGLETAAIFILRGLKPNLRKFFLKGDHP